LIGSRTIGSAATNSTSNPADTRIAANEAAGLRASGSTSFSGGATSL
jgi:hypothetical protein